VVRERISSFLLEYPGKTGYSISMANRANDWFRQAEDDLHWAEDTLKAGRYAQVCYISQQVAEKSLKAYALYLDYDQAQEAYGYSKHILDKMRSLMDG
jgi:hypothetical protein